MTPLDKMDDELTPEQKLGSIIIQAFEGGYREFVPRWVWESHRKVNFQALQSAFDEYYEKRCENAPSVNI